MTTIGELAQFPRSELLRRLREAEARAVGMRDCDACGHPAAMHDGPCRVGIVSGEHPRLSVRSCHCAAFTAPTPDQRAAAAECGDVGGGRWRL